jgi:ABC-2 type transport system permease protein
VPLDLAAGNLFSIYSPTRIEAGVFGRQRASVTTVLASFGIRAALFGAGSLVISLSRHYGDSWKEIPIFLLPAGFAFMSYALALSRIDRIALDHRENLISQLGR